MRKPPAPVEDETRRRYATVDLGRLVGAVLGPTARRRGFTETAILADWGSIVGPTLAGRCQPVRVEFPRGKARGGTLELHARGGAALEIQHLAPQLLERINGFFGYAAIRRLRLIQAPPAAPARRVPTPPPRPLSVAEEELLRRSVGTLAGQPLGTALLALGRAFPARRR
jgi:hypothetical protein